MKRVLLLATNESDAGIGLWCLREAGYTSFAIGNQLKNQGLSYSPLCKHFFAIPEEYTFSKNSFEILFFLEALVKSEKLEIICPSGFDSIKFLGRYYNYLSRFVKVMPVPKVKTVENLHNKYSFSVFCKENGIFHPDTRLLESNEDLAGIPESFFPALIKPLSESSSKGVEKFDTFENLKSCLLKRQGSDKNPFPLILQKFIDGSDIDFNGFASRGKLNSWTIQRTIMVRRANEPDLKWIQFVENPEVLRLGKKIVEKSGYSGPIHIDFRIESKTKEVKAIEANPRFWATTLCSLCDGVNFFDVGIKSSFDSAYSLKPRYSYRLWGSPHKVLSLVWGNPNLDFVRLARKHSFVQVKYLALRSLFAQASNFKKASYAIKGVFKK
ncbi:MAG: hypothetical protein ABH872_04080 [Candidatus Omnitrophota bacterium]